MSNKLMIALIVEYLIVAGFCVYEKRWPYVLYWLSAALINGAVLWMGVKGGR